VDLDAALWNASSVIKTREGIVVYMIGNVVGDCLIVHISSGQCAVTSTLDASAVGADYQAVMNAAAGCAGHRVGHHALVNRAVMSH